MKNSPATHNQPNILFIVLDTLRRDHLSMYGYHHNTSPFLDEFADNATVFERAVAPAQWTIPSHASLFTGVYPHEHQLTEANDKLSGSFSTLAEVLQVDGYHTVAFCNNPLLGILDTDLQRGFGEFYNYAGASPNRPQDISRSAVRKALSHQFRKFAHRISNEFAQSDHLFRLSLNSYVTPLWTRLINFKGNTARSITDLIEYLEAYPSRTDQPFFAFINLMQAHLPYRPSQSYLWKFAPELKHDKKAYQFMNSLNGDAGRWAKPPDSAFSDWEQRVLDAFYDAEIAYQDEQLGRLLQFMQSNPALQDTLIVITADHGESHGDHEFFGHGFGVYQELVHVPLIIRMPEHDSSNNTIKENVSTRRIYHTILDMAGISPPADENDPNANVHGLSLIKTNGNRANGTHDLAISEAFPSLFFLNVLKHSDTDSIKRLKLSLLRHGIYADDYKLAMAGNEVEGLFDLQSDPSENHNLADAQPEKVQALAKQLQAISNHNEMEMAKSVTMDSEVADNLRALGYID